MDRSHTLVNDDSEQRDGSPSDLHPDMANTSDSDAVSSSSPPPLISVPARLIIHEGHEIPNHQNGDLLSAEYAQAFEIRPLPILPVHPFPSESAHENGTGDDESSVFTSERTQDTGGPNELQSLLFTHECPNCNHTFNLHEHLPAKDLVCGHVMCRSCFRYEERCPLCRRSEQSALEQQESGRSLQHADLLELSFLLPMALEQAISHHEEDSDQSNGE